MISTRNLRANTRGRQMTRFWLNLALETLICLTAVYAGVFIATSLL